MEKIILIDERHGKSITSKKVFFSVRALFCGVDSELNKPLMTNVGKVWYDESEFLWGHIQMIMSERKV